jgi:hypothetical protein
MAKKYTLHYLSDKEFDRLPYAKVKTSLGCADPETGNAYVRKTGIKPIDQFVTEHEIAELIAKVSPHEADGIRYKEGAGNFGQQLINAITGKSQYDSDTGSTPIPGESIGVGNTGIGGYGDTNNTSNTTSDQLALSNPVTGSLGASTGSSTGTTSGLTNAFNDYQANQLGFANSPVSLGGQTSSVGTTGSNLSTINSPSVSQNSWSSPSIADMFTTSQASNSNLGSNVSLGNQNYNITGGSNGLTATSTDTSSNLGFETPTTKANVPTQAITQATVAPSLQGGSEVSTQQAKQTTGKTPILESLFGKDWKQTLLGQGIKTGIGAGIALLGQGMAGETQTVNATDSALYNQVVERVQSGAQVELTPAQQTAITQNYDTQLENARKNIIARFKALRPGSDIANDSQLQTALVELENDFAEQKAAAITAAQLGLTQQQTAQLSQLAATDINTLATNAGISNQEAADFKNMMASLGSMVATGGQQRVYS